ncbi:MFS transporter (plasmid) [Paroceanicella profunda]|uniref:MFS transporter n=1 Tax=Paroceanicella profunda TaxID=2579971 RepID=A0A5B8G1W2_9RHOB|nr:MFS transporter [Paroceanicella profunda]QDL93880.1 MFS transporter [Paroceanicella profunda]
MTASARGAATAHPLLLTLALAVGGFAIGTTEFAAMSLLPFYARDFGIDEPTAGTAISAYALGVCVGAPVIAVLAAKLSRRVLLIGLMTLFALGNGLSALAPSYGVLVAFRFLSGLPHGAYFGVAALMAASLVPPNRRAQAMGRVMLGLTIATTVGVPLANAIGQVAGWRSGFVIVAGLAALTATLIAIYAPHDRPQAGASPLRELGALGRRQVWLTLGIGAVGFGGIFAVYTYLGSTLINYTHASPAALPAMLALFGLGMTVGTIVCARAADRAMMPAIAITLLVNAAALMTFSVTAGSVWSMAPVVFVIGCGGGLSTMLQARLMSVAAEAQTLAAALNHSAFNIANAIGPWLGGIAIAGGLGWPSIGWVGACLALGGLGLWAVTLADSRRNPAAA